MYAKHREILGRDALELTREAFLASAEGSEERRSARLLLDWQAESQSARELAPLDEREIKWEADAVVRLADGREIPFQRTSIELANSTDKRERATIEAARSARYGHPLGLAIFDLDGFKAVNDRYGHPAGTRCSRASPRRSIPPA